VLFEQGEPSSEAYFVERGQVRVARRAGGREVRVGTVHRGEFLGEMGVLESMPRTGTAMAVRETVVRALAPHQFFALMERSLAAYFEVLATLCERARRLNRQLPGARGAGLYEATCSIDGLAQLAEQRACDQARRLHGFVDLQVEHGRYIAVVYARYLRGEAAPEEMEQANQYFGEYLKVAGLGALAILPGTYLTIPLAAKLGKALGVDIFPAPPPEARIVSLVSS
jgi:CRP-like cAMP-binding protein